MEDFNNEKQQKNNFNKEQLLNPKFKSRRFSIVVSVSEVDRSPLDDNNILGLITEDKNEKYKVATAASVLKHLAPRNALQEVSSVTLKIGNVPLDKVLSVNSLYNGQ